MRNLIFFLKKIDHDVDEGEEDIDHQGDDDEELQGRAGAKIVAALAHGCSAGMKRLREP